LNLGLSAWFKRREGALIMRYALNDAEIEKLLAAASESGATEAGYVLLRLPLEVRDLFTPGR
jgi:DNA repair photolyase